MSRKSGYYRVMYYNNTWEPACYENNMGWKLIGSNQYFRDSDLQGIDPNPIVMEEEIKELALKIVGKFYNNHRSIFKNLDLPNEVKCKVLNYMGISCESIENH